MCEFIMGSSILCWFAAMMDGPRELLHVITYWRTFI
jgi:hypothetical protein